MSKQLTFAGRSTESDRLITVARHRLGEFKKQANSAERVWGKLSECAWVFCGSASHANLYISRTKSNQRQRDEFTAVLREFVETSRDILAELPSDLPDAQRNKLLITNEHCSERLKGVESRDRRIRDESKLIASLASTAVVD